MKKYISNLLSANPLCGIDTYKDTLNLQNGNLSRQIKKFVFDGTQSVYNCVVTNDSQNYCCVFRFSDIGMTDILDYNAYMSNIDYPLFISDKFIQKTDTKNTYYNDISDGEIGANSASGQNRYIIFCISGITTSEDYTQWFMNNPTTIYYILGTPATTTITTPTGLTGIVNGYLIQSGTPTPTAPIYPTANPVTMWADYTPNIYNSGWTTASGQPEKYNGGWS